jgi:hypothetical protein
VKNPEATAGAFGYSVHAAIACITPLALAIVVVSAITLATPGCRGTQLTSEHVIQSASQKLRQAVSSNVADEGRKAQMLMLVDQMEALQTRFNKETADFVANYRKLSADYDARRPAFYQLFSDCTEADEITAQLDRTSLEMDQSFLNLRFRVKDQTTRAEWAAIVSRPEP